MSTRDYRDIIGGGVIAMTGVSAMVYAVTSLRLGTLSHMGPGMFPAGLGGLLAICGVVTAIQGLQRNGIPIVVDVRSFVAVSLSILTFGMTIRTLGIIPAIFALTIIASRADSKLSWLGVALVAGILSVGTILIFRVGLGMPLPIAIWPW